LSEKPNVSFEDYRAALVKNEALQTEITQLKDQLKDATDALTIVKAKFDVAEKARAAAARAILENEST
jgi:cell division septum initiation protein DivIVA